MDRGMLTDKIKEKGISKAELRLMPYLQYLLVNQMSVDPQKISSEERGILQKWRDKGYITFSVSKPCTITKEFWDEINECLYESYVIHKKGD